LIDYRMAGQSDHYIYHRLELVFVQPAARRIAFLSASARLNSTLT
jgi:hypothetical protein